MCSSISLISLRRVLRSNKWNKWHCIKHWDVISRSKLQDHRRIRKTRKLYLNLRSFKWDRPIQNLASNCNPKGLWIPNVSKCIGQMKVNKFLIVFYGAMFVIFISSLFHSFMTSGGCLFNKLIFNFLPHLSFRRVRARWWRAEQNIKRGVIKTWEIADIRLLDELYVRKNEFIKKTIL